MGRPKKGELMRKHPVKKICIGGGVSSTTERPSDRPSISTSSPTSACSELDHNDSADYEGKLTQQSSNDNHHLWAAATFGGCGQLVVCSTCETSGE